MIKIGVGIKARVIKSDQPNIKAGDVFALFEHGDRYEKDGFFFDVLSDGKISMSLFHGDVLLEEIKQ